MKEFVSPELTPIEDLVEGVYAASGAEPPMRYNPDWSYQITNYGSDGGSHTDLTIELQHMGGDYASPAGQHLVTEWATDFKINSVECVNGMANAAISTGDYGFTLKTTSGVNNPNERLGLTLNITGNTEHGSTAIGVSGGTAEENAHITNGITLIGWHYE